MSQIMNEAGNLELDIIRGDIAQDCGRLESVVELSESVRFDRPEFAEPSQVLDDLFGISESAGRLRLGGHDRKVTHRGEQQVTSMSRRIVVKQVRQRVSESSSTVGWSFT